MESQAKPRERSFYAEEPAGLRSSQKRGAFAAREARASRKFLRRFVFHRATVRFGLRGRDRFSGQ